MAWLLGFVAAPVPAGLGVREVTFVALSGVAAPQAALIAALSRLVFIAVDAVAALVAVPGVLRDKPVPVDPP